MPTLATMKRSRRMGHPIFWRCVLAAQADVVADVMRAGSFLEHEGGDIGAGDGHALGEVIGDDVEVSLCGAVEEAWRAEDGPGEVGLSHLVVGVDVVGGDVAEEGAGHDGVDEASFVEAECA